MPCDCIASPFHQLTLFKEVREQPWTKPPLFTSIFLSPTIPVPFPHIPTPWPQDLNSAVLFIVLRSPLLPSMSFLFFHFSFRLSLDLINKVTYCVLGFSVVIFFNSSFFSLNKMSWSNFQWNPCRQRDRTKPCVQSVIGAGKEYPIMQYIQLISLYPSNTGMDKGGMEQAPSG